MAKAYVVLVTAPNSEAAEVLCRELLDDGLIACGNVIPHLTSFFRWEGEIQEEDEVLILFKTDDSVLSQLIERISKIHPYEVPEVLAFPVAAGFEPYLEWVSRETGPRESS